MSLGFTPAVEIYGANAALLNERLLKWEHVDAAGIESDQLTLTISLDGLEGLPSLGGKIGLRVGYLESGLVDKGEFVITRRTPFLFPCNSCWWPWPHPSVPRTRPGSSNADPSVMARPPWGRCFGN